jgi:hypothetical protein
MATIVPFKFAFCRLSSKIAAMSFAEIHGDFPSLGVDDIIPESSCGAEIESLTDDGILASVNSSEEICSNCKLSSICEAADIAVKVS